MSTSDDAETRRLVEEKMRVLGVDEPTARFILAIERGEIDGDVIVVDEQGREIRQREEPSGGGQ